MEGGPSPEALVIRFRPATGEGMLGAARRAYAGGRGYTVSVLADVQRESETREQLIQRLLQVARLDGVAADGNPRVWVCASAANLYDSGYSLVKDGYAGEAAEHYSISFGSEPTPEQTEMLASLFERQEAPWQSA